MTHISRQPLSQLPLISHNTIESDLIQLILLGMGKINRYCDPYLTSHVMAATAVFLKQYKYNSLHSKSFYNIKFYSHWELDVTYIFLQRYSINVYHVLICLISVIKSRINNYWFCCTKYARLPK